jgi:peptide-methionine (S)-S-oxide reductase
VGDAVDGFFQRPYLLWFVAEDPVRRGSLPSNIVAIASLIIETARQHSAPDLQQLLDYALQLVAISWIARECGVQIDLIDVLARAGASLAGTPDHALTNGNFAAAEHLVALGAPLTLSTALCLGRWNDAARLAAHADPRTKQFSLVLAALRGLPDAVKRSLDLGADANRPSDDLYSHATPLHHAVGSGVLSAVAALVEAGAKLNVRDKAWRGTPLDWSQHYLEQYRGDPRSTPYTEISAYLRKAGAKGL